MTDSTTDAPTIFCRWKPVVVLNSPTVNRTVCTSYVRPLTTRTDPGNGPEFINQWATSGPMGHRTLVAYDRDGYDLHYAHWGVDPAELTPSTPFGGPPDDRWARERANRLLDPAGGELTEERPTAVDADPIATGLSFAGVCERIDPLEHEALFVVDPDFAVRRYLVVTLRTERNSQGATVALVGYTDDADAAYLRGWLAGARSVRDVTEADDDGIVRALRWLDPKRGTVVFLDGERDS